MGSKLPSSSDASPVLSRPAPARATLSTQDKIPRATAGGRPERCHRRRGRLCPAPSEIRGRRDARGTVELGRALRESVGEGKSIPARWRLGDFQRRLACDLPRSGLGVDLRIEGPTRMMDLGWNVELGGPQSRDPRPGRQVVSTRRLSAWGAEHPRPGIRPRSWQLPRTNR